jgi:hypothetical protein
VRGDDRGTPHTRQIPMNFILSSHVEMAGRLIKKKQVRLVRNRPRNRKALLLSSRETASTIGYSGFITHRHGVDLCVNGSDASGFDDSVSG